MFHLAALQVVVGFAVTDDSCAVDTVSIADGNRHIHRVEHLLRGVRAGQDDVLQGHLCYTFCGVGVSLKGNEDEDGVIQYRLSGAEYKDDDIVVIFNPSKNTKKVALPEGTWSIYVQGDKAGTELLGTASASVDVTPLIPKWRVVTTE